MDCKESLIMLKKNRICFLIFIIFYTTFSYALILGDGTNISQKTPIYIMDEIQQVSSDFNTTLFLKKNGDLYGCGKNVAGQLKSNDRNIYDSPILIEKNVVSCCVDYNSIYYVTKDGNLYIIGNVPASLDKNGFIEIKQSFIPILKDTNVVSVCASNNSCFYIKNDNTLWNFGANYNGVLGDGTNKHRVEPKEIMTDVTNITTAIKRFFALTKEGKVYKFEKEPMLVFEKVKTINGPFLITNNNDLYGIGYNSYSALGLEEKKYFYDFQFIMKDVLWADGNSSHSLIVNVNNELFTCGGGNKYDIVKATGDEQVHIKPDKLMDDIIYVSVGKNNQTSFILKKDYSLWACGQNNDNDVNGL